MDNNTSHKDWTSRKPFCVHWALMNQIYCVPKDMTFQEENALVQFAKEELGIAFKYCPDNFIRDRLVGGIQCPFHSERRHVLHDCSHYGYIAAEHRRYWPLDNETKNEIKERYKSACPDLWVGNGPFTN